mgnify:CR=1 FL=1
MFVGVVFCPATNPSHHERRIHSWRASSITVVALIIATLYSFTIVLRGRIMIVDAVVLVAIYVIYLYLTYHLPPESEEGHALPLVPRTISCPSAYVACDVSLYAVLPSEFT